MLDKEKVKEKYLAGYNSTEIAKMLSSKEKIVKKSTVKKCISRNFSDLKNIHLKNRSELKLISKAYDNELNSYIIEREFINFNRNSYIYNKNFNLKFNEEHGVATNGTPKTFYCK
ncbi:MAG: hypothetical protein MJH09_02040 [Cetobacterium sp.]|nr:hypothetical protein [Cetobacterium sp.]